MKNPDYKNRDGIKSKAWVACVYSYKHIHTKWVIILIGISRHKTQDRYSVNHSLSMNVCIWIHPCLVSLLFMPSLYYLIGFFIYLSLPFFALLRHLIPYIQWDNLTYYLSSTNEVDLKVTIIYDCHTCTAILSRTDKVILHPHIRSH